MERQAEFLRKQKPLKERYRSEPGSSRISLRARGSQADTPISCSVDIGRAVYEAQAHAGVGGTGTAACSGDLLLGALAACAQETCQMVAEAMGIEVESIEVEVEGELDLAGGRSASRKRCPLVSNASGPGSTSPPPKQPRSSWILCGARRNSTA